MALYNRAGIQFEYPENWKLTDDQFADETQFVAFETPGGGFWSLQVFSRWVSPEEATEGVVNTLREEYESLESELVQEVLGDVEMAGSDANFYCLDFVVAAKARAFHLNGKTFVVFFQAEDRDFDQLEPVFRAMIVSLLRRSVANLGDDAGSRNLPSPQQHTCGPDCSGHH